MKKNQINKKQQNSELPFRHVLKRLMKEHGFSIGQVAKMTGTRKSVVYNWTTGAVPYDLFAIKRLADAFKIPLSLLLFDENEDAYRETKSEQSLKNVEFPSDVNTTISGVFRVSITKLE